MTGRRAVRADQILAAVTERILDLAEQPAKAECNWCAEAAELNDQGCCRDCASRIYAEDELADLQKADREW